MERDPLLLLLLVRWNCHGLLMMSENYGGLARVDLYSLVYLA